MLSKRAGKTAQILLRNFLVLAVSFRAVASHAQVTSGTIFGTVKDPSGAVVTGASETISSPANGLTRKVTTSDSGEFVAPSLLPGTYTITIEATGFKKLESSGFVLSAADKLIAGELVLTMG